MANIYESLAAMSEDDKAEFRRKFPRPSTFLLYMFLTTTIADDRGIFDYAPRWIQGKMREAGHSDDAMSVMLELDTMRDTGVLTYEMSSEGPKGVLLSVFESWIDRRGAEE